MVKWWDAIPGRLDAELEELRKANLTFSCNEPDVDGFVEVTVAVKVDGADVDLIARYPDTFPYLRPEVRAPKLALEHHQNPFQKNLCLLGRRLDNWTPQMSLAQLIVEQLKLVLDSNRADDVKTLERLEELQAEPLTAFYSYEPGCVCFFDPTHVAAEEGNGSARFEIHEEQTSLRCAVLDITTEDGERQPTFPWPNKYRSTRIAAGRWAILNERIVENDPATFDKRLCELQPDLARNAPGGNLDLILVGFPDETEWRSRGLGWVLLGRKKVTSKGSFRVPRRFLVRVDRVDFESYSARSAETRGIANARVALFGVGCLGAPIALELARAGVKELLLIDGDDAEFAASVRWPLGLPAAGVPKVVALGNFLSANFPFTNVEVLHHRLGNVAGNGGLRDEQVLDRVLGGVDLIVDATAEFALQQMLSDFALHSGLTFVSAHATHGGYGGEVLRLRKGRTGCWTCLGHHRVDNAIPLPPTKEGPWTQPPGCAAPTFQGASWDITEVSLAAVRTIIDCLGNPEPTAPWDLSVVSLRNAHGVRTLPTWSSHQVTYHAKCKACAAK